MRSACGGTGGRDIDDTASRSQQRHIVSEINSRGISGLAIKFQCPAGRIKRVVAEENQRM